MANDMVGLAGTIYFTWSNPVGVNLALVQGRANMTGPAAAQSTRGASNLTIIVGNHSAGAVGVIVVVEWIPDDAGVSGAVGDECVLEQGALVAGVRRSLVLPTEFGPIVDSRPNVGCSIELPCAAHFYNVFMYTDNAPGNPQTVNVAVELSLNGADRNSVL